MQIMVLIQIYITPIFFGVLYRIEYLILCLTLPIVKHSISVNDLLLSPGCSGTHNHYSLLAKHRPSNQYEPQALRTNLYLKAAHRC